MKEKIIGFSLFFLVICFVVVNTLVLDREIGRLYELTKDLTISEDNIKKCEKDARELYETFKKKETFISLTVNHEDLTNIEESFSEIIGYLSIGDADGARVTKNRLLDSLEHLRRLSGFNIDAII